MKKLFLLFIISLSACSTYHMVDIDILTPSAYQIPLNTKSITLINNAQEQASSVGHATYKQDASYSTNARKRKISNDNIKVDSTSTSALYNMYNQLEESHLFTSIEIGRKVAKSTNTSESLQEILQQYPSDAVLFLQSLTYTDEKSQIYYQYYDLEETEIRVITKTRWDLYYADNSILPYSFTLNDTLFWNQADADRANCVLDGVWNNARRSAEKIIPHWISVNRLYYTGARFVYGEVNEAIKNKNWEQAGRLWISLYNKERNDSKQKARMAFNMALLFEMKNDLETSLEWLSTSIDIFTLKNAKNELEMCTLYAEVLNNRRLNQEKLDQQFTH